MNSNTLFQTYRIYTDSWHLNHWHDYFKINFKNLFARTKMLKRHVGNARIISRHLGTAWLSWSPDLNPCVLWLWGYLKDVVFSTSIAHLAELKACIAQHILNMTPETLWLVVEHDVSWFKLLAENGGQILNIFCTSFAKFKNQFDGCFLYFFWPQDS